jgi:hypothetical protein
MKSCEEQFDVVKAGDLIPVLWNRRLPLIITTQEKAKMDDTQGRLHNIDDTIAKESLRVWRLTRLDGVSASMASSGYEDVKLIKLFDKVRDAINNNMMDEHA